MAVTEEKTQQEPSMEEILSSIRRIISADGDGEREGANEPEPQAEQSEEARMDLREDDTPLYDAPEGEAEAEEPADDVLELTETVEEAEPAIEDDDEPFAAAESETETLITPTAEVASVTSLRALADAVAREGDIGGTTIEQLACELMRPMLREWLDRNLPDMVETLVRAEIRRLAERAKR